MKALGLVVSEKKIFFLCFSHCKSMGANNPRGGAILDPRGMIGRIYKEDHYTLLHTKYESFGPCGFGEEDPPGSNWCFSFAPELVGYSAPRDLHRRAAYSVCESWFLIHQDVYHDLFVCS